MTPAEVYARGLRDRVVFVRRTDGRRRSLPIAAWLGPPSTAEERVLDRAVAPVLDVGCGPGRLVLALARRSVGAVGVDIAPAAVRHARQRGAPVLHGSIFDPLPGGGRWNTALLLDGNIGIGGNPVALLERVRALLSPAGRILCELGPTGSGTRRELISLQDAEGGCSTWFAWARVGVEGLPPIAERARLRIDEVWEDDERWFAALSAEQRALTRLCRTAARPPVLARPATGAPLAARAAGA